MRSVFGILVAVFLFSLFSACGRPHEVAAERPSSPAPPPVAPAHREATAPTAATGTSEAHADHRPHHGGVVLMNGDLHFEVVLDRAGRYRVYFTDAVRRELPAAVASEVTVTIARKGARPEVLPLNVDSSAGAWTGSGEAVNDPAAMVRIAYVVEGKPYFIDLPFAGAAAAGRQGGHAPRDETGL